MVPLYLLTTGALVAMIVGTLARVAFESNGSVYEDSGYITDAFAHRFATDDLSVLFGLEREVAAQVRCNALEVIGDGTGPTMRGIVATNSTPSGEVGINRHLVINPNILDARGFIKVNSGDEYDGTELLSPGEALSPFGAESADIDKLIFSLDFGSIIFEVSSSVMMAFSGIENVSVRPERKLLHATASSR